MNKLSLFDLIRMSERVSNKMTLAWTRQFPHEIGVSEMLILSALEERGPEKSSVLADMHGYTKAAITNNANKLVKVGAVERVYDSTDRRIVRLRITNTGKKMLHDAKKTGTLLRERLFASLTKQERAMYYQIQQKILNTWEDE